MKNIINKIFCICLVGISVQSSSCKKLASVDAPSTSANADLVFSDDLTAAAVMTGVYGKIGTSIQSGLISLSIYPELSADNLTLFSPNLMPYSIFYKNNLSPVFSANSGPDYWTLFYQQLYNVNSIIENAGKSETLSKVVKDRLLGEAYFMRAFSYYYLVNLYGDVPLVTKTDYKQSLQLGRNSITEVYQQIIVDLKLAKTLLGENYVDGSLKNTITERLRPNKFAASALLARTYLHTGEYNNAESEATVVINNTVVYDTIPVNQVFLKNSKETIWALQPVRTGENTAEARFYTLSAAGPNTGANPVFISNTFLSTFTAGDKRRTNWIGSVTVGANTYAYPSKYKVFALNSAVSEYSIVLRYAEQLLIRAEARAQQGNVGGAQQDLNKIRKRAGLGNTAAANKEDLLLAVFQEKRAEFFTEWGHRWFDLKRTGKANELMPAAAIEKGGIWKPEWQLYPISIFEIQKSLKLSQNPGYQE